MVTVWAKQWQKWWIDAQDHLDDCPGVTIDPPNVNYSVCRAIRAIHIDWCSWAQAMRTVEQGCCGGPPTGHIPKPPDPPF
jgi:hypothetical protein